MLRRRPTRRSGGHGWREGGWIYTEFFPRACFRTAVLDRGRYLMSGTRTRDQANRCKFNRRVQARKEVRVDVLSYGAFPSRSVGASKTPRFETPTVSPERRDERNSLSGPRVALSAAGFARRSAPLLQLARPPTDPRSAVPTVSDGFVSCDVAGRWPLITARRGRDATRVHVERDEASIRSGVSTSDSAVAIIIRRRLGRDARCKATPASLLKRRGSRPHNQLCTLPDRLLYSRQH